MAKRERGATLQEITPQDYAIILVHGGIFGLAGALFHISIDEFGFYGLMVWAGTLLVANAAVTFGSVYLEQGKLNNALSEAWTMIWLGAICLFMVVAMGATLYDELYIIAVYIMGPGIAVCGIWVGMVFGHKAAFNYPPGSHIWRGMAAGILLVTHFLGLLIAVVLVEQPYDITSFFRSFVRPFSSIWFWVVLVVELVILVYISGPGGGEQEKVS